MPFGSENTEPGVGLALSGGGFRAVLFHAGALIRLNELGLLSTIKRISSVSGGAIVAGALAACWDRLRVGAGGRIENLEKELLHPLRSFCGRTIDTWSVIGGALNPWKTAGEEVAEEYREHLGMDRLLNQLPDSGPRFVFNATNYATGSSFRFSKPYCGDYRIGLIPNGGGFDLATAAASSSAFPPVLAPISIKVDPDKFVRTPGADLYDRIDFRRKLELADGGVYDNLGLETVWGRYDTVLVSDAGKPFEFDAAVSSLAPKQIFRVMDIGLTQALSLRKRMLIHQFRTGGSGAYWGIATRRSKYPVPSPEVASDAKVEQLSAIRTRLNRFSEQEQAELINWGYVAADSSLRSHMALPPGSVTRSSLPFKSSPLA